MEIVAGIHLASGMSSTFMGLYPPNIYLVVGKKAAFLDTGYGDEPAIEATLGYLNRIKAPVVKYIILTHLHPDHAGGTEKLKTATNAKVIAHPLEVSGSPSFVAGNELVEEGDTLDLEGIRLEVVHTPGHSLGHICLYSPQEKILFSGDHVLGIGTTVIFTPPGSMAQYIDSLRKLLNYDIEMICPGHGPVVREPRRKLQELIQHRLEREQQVLNCLRWGKVTTEEMVQEIYPELDHRLYRMAKEQVRAHLHKLEEEGRISSREWAGKKVYAAE